MSKRTVKFPNGSNPPVYSTGVATLFYDGLVKRPPPNDRIDESYITSIGITAGTLSALLSGLRWHKLIDANDKLVDRKLPSRLADPLTRREVFQDILARSYPDLLRQPNLERMTIQSLTAYFEHHHVKDGTSGRAARLFVWLAQQGGIRLRETISSSLSRPVDTLRDRVADESVYTPPPSERAEISPSIDEQDSADIKRFQRIFARRVAEDMEAGKEVDLNIFREFNRLIDSIQGDAPFS